MAKSKKVLIDRELVEYLRDFASEDLGCDHSVGICMCELIGIVDETGRQLRGKQVCPECAGEQQIWDQNLADRRDAADKKKGFEPYDQNGMKKCPKCRGKGEIRLIKG